MVWEALVPEELEKHLMHKSNRLRTFEDVRLEIVTFAEAKFGLTLRDSKQGESGAREHSSRTGQEMIESTRRLNEVLDNRLLALRDAWDPFATNFLTVRLLLSRTNMSHRQADTTLDHHAVATL